MDLPEPELKSDVVAPCDGDQALFAFLLRLPSEQLDSLFTSEALPRSREASQGICLRALFAEEEPRPRRDFLRRLKILVPERVLSPLLSGTRINRARESSKPCALHATSRPGALHDARLADVSAAREREVHPQLSNVPETIGWISLAQLARELLGRGGARSARDWCKQHRVPYVRDGKHNWVRVEAVQQALDALAVRGTKSSGRSDAVGQAAAAMMRRR